LQGPKEKDVADAAGGSGSSQSKTPSELTRKQNWPSVRGLLPAQLKYLAMNPTKTRLARPKSLDIPEVFVFGCRFIASHHSIEATLRHYRTGACIVMVTLLPTGVAEVIPASACVWSRR
jgi:hypothetical protein